MPDVRCAAGAAARRPAAAADRTASTGRVAVTGGYLVHGPLAIILVLAVGGIVAGIPGAIIAVPAAAVIFYASPFLRREQIRPEQQPGQPPVGR